MNPFLAPSTRLACAMVSSPVLRPDVFSGVPVVAGFSTRHGGVSDPPYDSLNLGPTSGGDREAVQENLSRFCDALGIAPEALAAAGQVHGGTVRVVDDSVREPHCDGLVTAEAGVYLSIGVADCAAVLLADAQAGVVGACHSGWRGTVARIAEATVETMAEQGADPSRIRAYVSPCISLDAFEVGPEVAAQFDEAFVHVRDAWERPHVDLKAAITAQLRNAGVPDDAIEVSGYCTVADGEHFFSYRADDGVTGRLLGVIGLRGKG